MVDLSRKELEANLWLVHVVEAAFSHEPPSGTVLGSLKRKLLAEAQTAPRKGADIPGPSVVVEGKGWTRGDPVPIRPDPCE